MLTLEIMTFILQTKWGTEILFQKEETMWHLGRGEPRQKKNFFFFYSTLFLKQVKYLNKKHIHFCQIHPCYAFIHIRKRPVFTLIPTSFPEALVRFSTMTVSHVYLKFLYSVIILSLCVCMHACQCMFVGVYRCIMYPQIFLLLSIIN